MSLSYQLIAKKKGTWSEDERSYEATYLVRGATLGTASFSVLNGSGLYGSVYADDTYARCWNLTATEMGNDHRAQSGEVIWELQASWSTKKKDGGVGTNNNWLWSWTGNEETEPKYIDVDGNAYTTSAGEPFDNQKEGYIRKWTATGRIKVAPTFSLSSVKGLVYTYNSSPIMVDGVSIGTAHGLLKPFQLGEVMTEGNGQYREFTVTIEILDDKTWSSEEIWDVGYDELAGGGERTPILCDDGQTPVSKPYPLDGSGHKKSSPTDTPETLTFKWYNSGDWSTFSFT